MLIINDTLGTYGGSITLINRICEWTAENKIKTAVLCESDSNIEITSKLKELGVSIVCTKVSNTKKTIKLLKSFIKEEEIIVISFVWNLYLDIEKAKKRGKLRFKNVIYSIHPATFYKGQGLPFAFLKQYVKIRYKKLLNKINESNSLIFMDSDTISKTEIFYNFKFKSKPKILPLPMICQEIDELELEKIIRLSYENKILLTASRAEFPFKGYMFGLVDDFKFLKQKYPDLKLIIVSSGDADDVEKLETKIKEDTKQYLNDIQLINWIPYNELKKIIKKCIMFIGMGTGILDAALLYKPAVPVRYKTYENLSDNFFADNPISLISSDTCKQQARVLIERVLNMSFEEYRQCCINHFFQAKKFYDINNFINFLFFEIDCTQESVLSVGDILSHSLNVFINSFKKLNKYDYNTMKKNEERRKV